MAKKIYRVVMGTYHLTPLCQMKAFRSCHGDVSLDTFGSNESVPVIIIVKQLRPVDSTKHHMVGVGFALLTGTSWRGNHLMFRIEGTDERVR
jgi:hypothetical protein